MQVCDLVVLPSVTIEGLGICLIEAAMLRKPVVGSDAPGVREALVDGETGLLAAPGDSADLAAKIAHILGDPGLAADMGERGRERALEKFTVERITDTIESVYLEAIADTHREPWC